MVTRVAMVSTTRLVPTDFVTTVDVDKVNFSVTTVSVSTATVRDSVVIVTIGAGGGPGFGCADSAPCGVGCWEAGGGTAGGLGPGAGPVGAGISAGFVGPGAGAAGVGAGKAGLGPGGDVAGSGDGAEVGCATSLTKRVVDSIYQDTEPNGPMSGPPEIGNVQL